METIMTFARIALAAALGLLAAGPALAQRGQPSATTAPTRAATMMDAAGKQVGTITLAQYPAGLVIRGELQGLPPGWHGFHIHEKGACTPAFDAVGGHFKPGKGKHGLNQPSMHAGDRPNIHVHADGAARFEFVTTLVSIGGGATDLLDQDGSSVMVHDASDDYVTDPSGHSGGRIACGVIK